MTTVGFSTITPFVGLFVLFMVLGFYGKYWRRGNLNDTHEWSLGGRKLGTTLVFFLLGADIYTAFAFVAIPSGVFAKGSLYFFAIPYGALTFGIALAIMPKLLALSKEKGYITASDFIKDRFGSKTLSILVAITGIVSLLPYIALQTTLVHGYSSSWYIHRWSGTSSNYGTSCFYLYERFKGSNSYCRIKGCTNLDNCYRGYSRSPSEYTWWFWYCLQGCKAKLFDRTQPTCYWICNSRIGKRACTISISPCDKWCFELRECT